MADTRLNYQIITLANTNRDSLIFKDDFGCATALLRHARRLCDKNACNTTADSGSAKQLGHANHQHGYQF